MAKTRNANAADLSERINVAFDTSQIDSSLCNYWHGLQRISETSPPEDVTVGQVKRVGHSRLDPDCASTDYGWCGDGLAETLRPYHLASPYVERAEDAGLTSENNKIAKNGRRTVDAVSRGRLPENVTGFCIHAIDPAVAAAYEDSLSRSGSSRVNFSPQRAFPLQRPISITHGSHVAVCVAEVDRVFRDDRRGPNFRAGCHIPGFCSTARINRIQRAAVTSDKNLPRIH